MATMARYANVLFDFDYTLADSSPGIIESVNWAFASLGMADRSEAAIRRTIGLSLRDTFAALVDDERSATENDAALFVERFVGRADEVMADATSLLPGAREAVAALADTGATLAVVSTKFRRRIESVLAREELREPFSVIVGGEDVTAHKPDPACLFAACAALEASPSECVYVGDSVVDGQAADAAGMPFVGVLSGTTDEATLREWHALTVLSSVAPLPDWLEGEADDG
jgi:phosphoglycolate phosphatase